MTSMKEIIMKNCLSICGMLRMLFTKRHYHKLW